FGGRVKTLHPGVFGGILHRRNHASDIEERSKHNIPSIDCVVVDLYPFEDTVASGGSHDEIIEKIDIGGISLIRAGAKNYGDVVIIPSMAQYANLSAILQAGGSSYDQRKELAAHAFRVSSSYDRAIYNYFSDASESESTTENHLRYGENPHQKGIFQGNLDALFAKLNGKELSYNNLLDVDAAVRLLEEFKQDAPTFAILKHNNACGIATRNSISEAYVAALACDPTSAFGGVLICNRPIDFASAQEIHKLFCEVVIAPDYQSEALELLKEKPNRIILKQHPIDLPKSQLRSALNGHLWQETDTAMEDPTTWKQSTNTAASNDQIHDLLFALKVAKHTKSNTIVLAKNLQLCAAGTGQTSRVDALKQAIEKAQHFGFNLQDSVMASDAFFPFPDCVEIAKDAGITAVIQPGGSVKDQLSIDFCNAHQVAMYLT
ncbi:MAG: bifunctional phosphoribosylaminoimidazolecarboxamide formyltransferase/IMP cyclohydrolase, partial [Flavobacteriales bacterium]